MSVLDPKTLPAEMPDSVLTQLEDLVVQLALTTEFVTAVQESAARFPLYVPVVLAGEVKH